MKTGSTRPSISAIATGMLSPWMYLVIAGAFEVGFTTCLKLSNGLTRPGYTAGFVILSIFSFLSLSRAIMTLPIGTAYAVWTGIGAFGTAIVGIVWFSEPVNAIRLLLLALLISAVLGLKFTSP